MLKVCVDHLTAFEDSDATLTIIHKAKITDNASQSAPVGDRCLRAESGGRLVP